MAQLTIQHAFDLALQHHQGGRLHEAEALYRQILAQHPEHAEAMHHLGVIAHQMGQNDIAVDLIRQSIALRPDCAQAHSNLGNALALRDNGQFDEAIVAYRRALALNPNLPEAHNNLGIALKSTGHLDEAIVAGRRAIALSPNYAEAHSNLGNTLRESGQLDEAIAAYRQAIALRPDNAQSHNNLAIALTDKGQLDEAIAAYRQAISLRPNFPEAHNNLGNALKKNSRFDEALAAYRQATSLRPSYAKAHSNLGSALQAIGRLDEAVAALRQAIALDPDNALIGSNLLYTLNFHPGYDARAIAEEQRRWNRHHAEPLRKFNQSPSSPLTPSKSSGPDHSNDPVPDRRLRIGYVSPDFKDHVVGRNLLPLFRQHDRRQFDITCYAQVPWPDAMTRQFQQNADCWRNIVRLSDEQAARQIQDDRIDILVDLTLHMADNRLLIFARKPAPVQVTWLGYCGSTGMGAMDYRLSDPNLDPQGTDLSCYAENTVYLPRTYWCYQPYPAPQPSPAPALKNGFVTFGCLNNFAKVSPTALDLWTRIVAATPNSRMIIHSPPGSHLKDVEQRFQRAGVTENRLRFVGNQPSTQYVLTYSQIDIALDPFPYSGGITTCDALWMGAAVVSLSGHTAVGRGGRSILSNLGLTELIAFTPDQYMQIALDLAGDLDRLDGLRQSMRARMLASPLIDAEGFARDVEAAYRQMWHAWCQSVSARS